MIEEIGMSETVCGHWAVACLEHRRRQLTLTLPEAEAVRKFWKAKYPNSRVIVRPLTDAAMNELYRLNGWSRPLPKDLNPKAEGASGTGVEAG